MEVPWPTLAAPVLGAGVSLALVMSAPAEAAFFAAFKTPDNRIVCLKGDASMGGDWTSFTCVVMRSGIGSCRSAAEVGWEGPYGAMHERRPNVRRCVRRRTYESYLDTQTVLGRRYTEVPNSETRCRYRRTVLRCVTPAEHGFRVHRRKIRRF